MLATLTPLSKRTAVCEASALARAVWTMVFGAPKRCLTFEFSRGQRHGAWAVWRMINSGATRPKRHADDRRLQRGVRHHCWGLPRASARGCPSLQAPGVLSAAAAALERRHGLALRRKRQTDFPADPREQRLFPAKRCEPSPAPTATDSTRLAPLRALKRGMKMLVVKPIDATTELTSSAAERCATAIQRDA
jgi:hypothetical protein